jgi:hypothetical protein
MSRFYQLYGRCSLALIGFMESTAKRPTLWRDRAARDELYLAGAHRPGARDAEVCGVMRPS